MRCRLQELGAACLRLLAGDGDLFRRDLARREARRRGAGALHCGGRPVRARHRAARCVGGSARSQAPALSDLPIVLAMGATAVAGYNVLFLYGLELARRPTARSSSPASRPSSRCSSAGWRSERGATARPPRTGRRTRRSRGRRRSQRDRRLRSPPARRSSWPGRCAGHLLAHREAGDRAFRCSDGDLLRPRRSADADPVQPRGARLAISATRERTPGC